MRDRPRMQRCLARRSLRKQLSHSDEQRSALIRLALADEAVFETFYEQAMSNAGQYAIATGEFNVSTATDGTLVVDNLLKLLTWFLENGVELIRIIELIVEMFGTSAEASAIFKIESF